MRRRRDPRCRTHGRSMRLRPPGTPEQEWCGTWYECSHPGCHTTVLVMSPALAAEYATREKEAHRG